MSTETDDGTNEFPADVMGNVTMSPVEQVDNLIANAELDVERHTANLKRSRELLKRLRATRQAMND
jgi:hypothetical protein